MKHRKGTRTDDGKGADSEIWLFILPRHEKSLCVYASVICLSIVLDESLKNLDLCIAWKFVNAAQKA